MKVILIRELNPFFESSASGNRFASLVKGLAENGIEMTVVVTGGYNNPQEKKMFKKHSFWEGVEIIYLISLLNHSLWLRRLNKYLLSGLINKTVCFRLKKIFKRRFDYVWITNRYMILDFFNQYLSKKGGFKSLMEINEFHDVFIQESAITDKAQLKYAKKNVDGFLAAIKRVDCLAVMTQTLIGYYRSHAKEDAVFLHLPMTVDMGRFVQKEKKCTDVSYIAFAGSLSNRKEGIDILIQSFAKIVTDFPDVELRLAGPYHPDISRQKKLIAKLGIESKVRYVGELPKEDIPSFFKEAKLLVLPRPDSHQAQGGFPTKLGEYLSTANPVCITSVGEIPEYLTDNISAFMAIPGDVDSFADALRRALLDDVNARKIGYNGYLVACRNFDIKKQAQRFKAFLEDNI